MAFNCGSIFVVLFITWPLIWAADSVEPSFDHQLTSHEIKTEDKQRIVDGLNYFLDNPRSMVSPSSSSSPQSASQLTGSPSSPSSSSINAANLYDDLYGNRGNNYLTSSEDNLIDSVLDLPGKRKFIPLRGRKESESPIYHYYYPGLNSFTAINDGYRKKAAFTGMRGKKMDPKFSTNQLGQRSSSGMVNSRQIFGSMIADLPWISFTNLNEPNGYKRSRPFAAMRGKRSI